MPFAFCALIITKCKIVWCDKDMIELNNTLTDTQMSLLGQLFSRGSLDLLQGSVNGIDGLDYFQTVAVAYAVITKSCLLNIDTGLGKTLLAAGIMNVVSTLMPDLKWVYLCQCSNLKTTADKLKKHLYEKNLVFCDSTEERVLNTFFTLKATNANVIVLSYEAITLPAVESFIFKHRNVFRGLFLDESQMLSNLESHTSRLVSAIMNSCEYRIMLSATPLRIAVQQVVNQIYMLDRKMFEGVTMSSFMNQFMLWNDHEIVGYRNLDDLQTMLLPRMLSISRADISARGTYTPYMKICDSQLHKDASIADVMSYKTQPFSRTMRTLVQIINSYRQQGKRGLVYANRNILKSALKSALSESGFIVDILDGSNTSTQKAKEIVHRRFLDGELDVLITNITMGKDLPCDYIVFYELTFDYKQMIGRGERGLSGTDLDIVFIITDSLYEMRYFYVNVYQRGILLETLCAKDLPELHSAVEQLKCKLAEKGTSLAELLE